jgi:hypothetical protein
MKLDWKGTYLNYIAKKVGMEEENIDVEGVPVSEVAHRFVPPRIDMPVKVQMEIYKHEYLTKLLFCSLDIVKLFQKVTVAYRGQETEIG